MSENTQYDNTRDSGGQSPVNNNNAWQESGFAHTRPRRYTTRSSVSERQSGLSGLEEEDSDIDDQTTVPVTAYVQQYLDEGSYFPVQEVVPNTSLNMNMYRRKRGNTVTSNVIASRPMEANYTGSVSSPDPALQNQNNEGGVPANDPNDPNNVNNAITMMVKPKTLYQNPQTPTVLPSTYYPINKWSSFKYQHMKEFFGEFLGTMIMMMFGTAVVCQSKLSEQDKINQFNQILAMNHNSNDDISMLQYIATPNVAGNFVSIAFGWAGAVVMGYFAAGGSAISGAHLNPAITVSNFIYRGFPFRKLGVYFMGQYVGSYLGSLLMIWYYHKVIAHVYPNWPQEESVVAMFSVVPLDYLSTPRQIIAEFVIGAMLQCGIFSLTDPYTCLSTDLFPVMLFILIFSLNASGAYQTGAVLNPARDMGPRLALWTIGMDKDVIFNSHHHFFWVAMVVPFLGSFAGGFVYDFCIYQGHESPLNLPLSAYTDWFRRQWDTIKLKTSSGLKGTDLETINSDHTLSHIESHRSQLSENKQVHFKSVLRNSKLRNPSTGVPTIFESEETTYSRPNFEQKTSNGSI